MRGRKGEACVGGELGVQSPGVARFRTDQSDFLGRVNSTIGQDGFYEHPQVEAPILQGRRGPESWGGGRQAGSWT